ncbi:MAG: phosphatidylglycerophosphatase A [Gammaproteobacteria bacterium]|nr:phosphatidylglycerophosphatase A [Gammaproteobacteria bacterium]
MTQQQTRWGHRLAQWLATGFGVGYIGFAPGTFGTLVALPLYLLVRELPPPAYVAVVAALFALGVWICQIAERQFGRPDHSAIVWDEIVGYLVTMFLAPSGMLWIVAGFVLFRLFDIWKPFPIRRLEHVVPGGWGVMADDVLAGIYAAVMLRVLAMLLATRQLS